MVEREGSNIPGRQKLPEDPGAPAQLGTVPGQPWLPHSRQQLLQTQNTHIRFPDLGLRHSAPLTSSLILGAGYPRMLIICGLDGKWEQKLQVQVLPCPPVASGHKPVAHQQCQPAPFLTRGRAGAIPRGRPIGSVPSIRERFWHLALLQ